MIIRTFDELIYLVDGLGYYKLDQHKTANEFLKQYNIKLISNDLVYILEFETDQEETIFRLKYSNLLL